MPFPLAHPAAVLPLRRIGAGWLIPAALVVGSIVPDTSYFLSRWRLEELAHTWAGTILYALPAGALALAVARAAGGLAVRCLGLDEGWLRLLGPAGPLWATLLSLLVGAGTHLAWDSITHKGGWLVEAWPALRVPLFEVLGRSVRGHHFLWYISSFGGLAAVYWAFDRAARRALGRAERPGAGLGVEALVVASLGVAISAVHHVIEPPWGNLLAATCTLALLTTVLSRLENAPREEGSASKSAF
jgi:hypothetical protein